MPGRHCKYPDTYRANITLSHQVWDSAARKAKGLGLGVSEVINRLLSDWIAAQCGVPKALMDELEESGKTTAGRDHPKVSSRPTKGDTRTEYDPDYQP